MRSRSKRRKLWQKRAVAIIASLPVALFAACDVIWATDPEIDWGPPTVMTAIVLLWIAIAAFASRAGSAEFAASRAFKILAVLAFLTPLLSFGYFLVYRGGDSGAGGALFLTAAAILNAVVAVPVGLIACCYSRALDGTMGDPADRTEGAV